MASGFEGGKEGRKEGKACGLRLFLRDCGYFAWLLIGLGGMMGISVAGEASYIAYTLV